MSWKESYACHILKRRLESMQTKLCGKWSQGKDTRYQEYDHKKNMIRVFRSFTPLQVYPLTPLWVHLQKKSSLPTTSPVCSNLHQFAPNFTNSPPPFTNLPLPLPSCLHFHEFAPTFTNLPPPSPIHPHLHQVASTLTNLPPPSPCCLHLHQFAPTFTKLPPLHQLAPTFPTLPPPSPICPHLHQVASTFT